MYFLLGPSQRHCIMDYCFLIFKSLWCKIFSINGCRKLSTIHLFAVLNTLYQVYVLDTDAPTILLYTIYGTLD